MKWKTGLPKKSGVYICYSKGHIYELDYSNKHKAFNASDNQEVALHKIVVEKWVSRKEFFKQEKLEDKAWNW